MHCAVVLGCVRLRAPTEPTASSAQRAQGQGIGHAGDCLCGWVPVLLGDLHGSKSGEQVSLILAGALMVVWFVFGLLVGWKVALNCAANALKQGKLDAAIEHIRANQPSCKQ